jgi:hypothetical protein
MEDRIKELRRVKASELLKNEMNWRLHPPEQRQALREVLERIGYAGALVARELDGGGLQLIDGHLRAEVSADEEVPVLVVDLTDEEAKLMLATYDPLSAMADQDDAVFKRLLESISLDGMGPHLGQMFDELRGSTQGGGDDDEELAVSKKHDVMNNFSIAAMELRPEEHYDFLVVMATGPREWNQLVEKLELQPQPQRYGKFGISRGVRAKLLLEKLK